jgi:hypothetical protein
MNLLENCSAIAGVALSDDACLLTLMNDGLAAERKQHSIPALFSRNAWTFLQNEPALPWIAAGVARIDGTSGGALIVGWGGQVLVLRDHAGSREAILRRDFRPTSIIRCVSSIGDAVYAAGMGRQVYERTDVHGWREIDHDVVGSGEVNVGFNAIDGFDRGEIYAAGMSGEVWRYDGQMWRRIDIPASTHLHSLCCAADGLVYIGSRSGVLIRGRNEAWDVLDVGVEETVWDVEWFDGALYLIVGGGIQRYVGDRFERVEEGSLGGDFEMFSSSRNRMWVFGRKKTLCFDGAAWSQVPSEMPESAVDARLRGFFNNDVLERGSEFIED